MRLKPLTGMMAAITMLLANVIVAAPADPAAQNLQDRAVQAQLNRPLPAVTFDAVGLSDVVDFLRDVSGADIFVNWKALEAAGVQRTTPISVKARNVAFGTALQLILDSAGGPKARLAFEMRNGVITISTADALKVDTIRKTYDIHFLLPDNLDAASRDKRLVAIISLVKGSVDPKSWQDHPASCAVTELKGELTVSQTAENQKQVENVIAQVHQLIVLTKSP